jgi:hypothetical protein
MLIKLRNADKAPHVYPTLHLESRAIKVQFSELREQIRYGHRQAQRRKIQDADQVNFLQDKTRQFPSRQDKINLVLSTLPRDALGNTTTATGKGFAIESAVLTSLSLLNLEIQSSSEN